MSKTSAGGNFELIDGSLAPSPLPLELSESCELLLFCELSKSLASLALHCSPRPHLDTSGRRGEIVYGFLAFRPDSEKRLS